jgi:hypothetical protein
MLFRTPHIGTYINVCFLDKLIFKALLFGINIVETDLKNEETIQILMLIDESLKLRF